MHATGVVKPDDPDAKIKFLAEEALHGVGGFVFDAHGNRVANELRERNCVTGEMWENKPPFSLALNNAISDDRQCKHYTGRGVRKFHESGTALVEGMEAPVSKMPDSSEAHYQASLKTTRNPNGEPYAAFASDKSWSEASGETGSEKKFYHNVSSGADFAAQPFCVAEYVEPTPEVTYGHVAHVVECVTPASSVAYTAPVTTRTVAHRQVHLIQRVQKIVEVPHMQFIDRLVDDPAVMQREAFNIEARELIEDDSVGAKQQMSERPFESEEEETPRGNRVWLSEWRTIRSRCRVEPRAVQGLGPAILSIVPLCEHCLQ